MGTLALAGSAVASASVRLLSTVLIKAKSNKRVLAVAGIIIASTVIAGGVYLHNILEVRTYTIAYVGRYKRAKFDTLHEIALRKYLDELNTELKNVRLELETFNNDGNAQKSRAIYEQISRDNKVIAVIDNTWGSEIQPVAGFIRENKIPVIAINADKQAADFANCVVFLGHDDFAPETIANFSTKVLDEKRIIFITEEDYAATGVFDEKFKNAATEVTRFGVKSSKVEPNESEVLFKNLDSELEQWRQRQEQPAVVINTHAEWGSRIIKHLDEMARGVTIVGGPYISDSSNISNFGQNNNGNRLIMHTSPVDVITNKLYYDLKDITVSDPEATGILNVQLFVKRCLDAVSIMRGVFTADSGKGFRSDISRVDFINFFQKRLVANDYIGKYDLYSFDENLLLSEDKTFEEHIQGEHSSYPKQLNSQGDVIPNVYFGIEIINISNIDISSRSFHADFFYWLKYDKGYPDIDKYIHFRNEKQQGSAPETAHSETVGSTIYKIYKKSGDFSIAADFTEYPFDIQELKIELALIIPSDQVLISFDHAGFNDSKKRAEEFSLNDWYLKDFYVSVDNFIATSSRGGPSLISKKPRKFKTLTVRVPIQRRLTGPFVTIILPLIMIGFAAIAVLYIRDDTFGYIGEVSSAIFLSIVAYSISFSELTPRSNILTTADMLFYFTFFTVLLIFMKVILFNSHIISDHVRIWASDRATLVGSTALAVYCLTVAAILLSGMI
jgi:hypothetical protein